MIAQGFYFSVAKDLSEMPPGYPQRGRQMQVFLFLFLSRPRSEGWPHHGRTFSIYPCPLSF